MSRLTHALLSLLLLPLAASVSIDDVGYSVATPSSFDLLKSGKNGGSLYQVNVPDAQQYNDTLYLLKVTGSHYDMGYDQGYLVGHEMVGSLTSLLATLTGGSTILMDLAEVILGRQWETLQRQTPQEFLDEMQGLTDGGKAAGVMRYEIGNLAAWGVVMANLPGDMDDLVYVLMDEFEHDEIPPLEKKFGKKLEDLIREMHWQTLQCSNFGVWGSRTTSGELYTGRNLDWETDTGINQYKLLTVYAPDGQTPHATVGFAGILGALTGMSKAGLTVHEANLESDQDSFNGFPWTLRLRAVMEDASNLDEAKAIWESTNNTCGFNHAVGSAADAKFLAIETDAGHSAYFFDMDDREVNAENGDPRPDALYRTNHGFDPQTVAHYQWNGTHADSDSNYRYALFPQIFDSIDAGEYDVEDAIATVAIIGQKGDDYWQCGGPGTYSSASNVLSVAFQPSTDGNGVIYAAWEVGSGDDWVPACCGTFIKFEMSKWW